MTDSFNIGDRVRWKYGFWFDRLTIKGFTGNGRAIVYSELRGYFVMALNLIEPIEPDPEEETEHESPIKTR